MHFTVLEVILSVFFTALFVTVLFRQLKISIILGYLLVGALVGPHALKWVPDIDYLDDIAEFGIVFLMFTVGLEFSVARLFALRHAVFTMGGLQVLACVCVSTVIGLFLEMTLVESLIVGSIVAMSSTALVVKQLNDQFELQTPHGLNAVGVLLFQDLAVIPLVILITSLASGVEEHLLITLLWAVIKGGFAILIIFLMGRLLLQPLFRLIGKTHAIELFTMSVLFITLFSAWMTQALGLSYSLGAFLAGIMLSETTYRHQIEVEIRPFRDMLLGLFFITIGMLANTKTWYATWPWILLMLSAMTIGKLLVIVILARLTKNNLSTSIRTGIILAQGGEFGFAILSLAMNKKMINPAYQQVILATLLLSLALAPLLIRFNKQIADFFTRKPLNLEDNPTQHQIIEHAKSMMNHVVICGYGRVGQHMARLLDKINFPYIAIDFDPELVQRASLAGDAVIYGDPSNYEILRKAGLDHSKLLLIALNEHEATVKILEMVRASYPKLPVLVRCRDKIELNQIKKIGPTHVIAELFEASLSLSHHLLQYLDLPRAKIADIIQDIRNRDYDLLDKVFVGTVPEDEESEFDLHEQLSPITISENAFGVGRTLAELNLPELGVEIIALRRGNAKHVKPRNNIKIHAGDIIVLFGSMYQLEMAERRLLEG